MHTRTMPETHSMKEEQSRPVLCHYSRKPTLLISTRRLGRLAVKPVMSPADTSGAHLETLDCACESARWCQLWAGDCAPCQQLIRQKVILHNGSLCCVCDIMLQKKDTGQEGGKLGDSLYLCPRKCSEWWCIWLLDVPFLFKLMPGAHLWWCSKLSLDKAGYF